MKIEELLEQGRKRLKEVQDVNLITRILLSYLLKKDKVYLVMHKDESVPPEIEERYHKTIEKIAEGYPLQYIIHEQEFMKLPFYVNEHVLIPRPDTETLVEEILRKNQKEYPKILDICTGSGAIGISLAYYIPNAEVYLSDISSQALEIAKKNARKNGVEEQLKYFLSDMFQTIPKETFDIIVSNPPYIETKTISRLEKQVQQEPRIALDGGEDGLDYYRILIAEASKLLKPEGILGLEIGYNQKEDVLQMIEKNNQYQKVYIKQDLAGRDRVVIARRR